MSLNTHSLDLEASSSQYAGITDASQTGLDITGDMTIEFWAKPESIGTHMVVTKYGNSGQRSFQLYMAGGDTIAFSVSNNGTSLDNSFFTTSYSVDTWQHWAVSYKSSTGVTNLYKDGLFVATDTLTVTSIFNSNADFTIGSRGTSLYYDGLLDEVRIWNVERTGTQISNNYNKQITGNEIGLQGYWRFNNDYIDETSNGNNLTAVNSPNFTTDVPFPGSEDISTSNFLQLF